MKATRNTGILWFICGLMALMMACKPQASEPANVSSRDTLVPPGEVIVETTAIPEEGITDYPAGYAEDAIDSLDSTTHHRSSVYFPTKRDDAALNQVVRNYCAQYAKGYYPDTPRDEFDNSEFTMWVRDMHVTGDILSIQWLEQSFYSGAAHFNHGNPCLNLNLETHKKLTFPEMFHFTRLHSKQEFCQILNWSKQGGDGSLLPEDLARERNFFIAQDSLVLCFDDYDRGPSMTQMKASLAEIAPFWSAAARKAMGLEKN